MNTNLTPEKIAGLLGCKKPWISKRAAKERWPYSQNRRADGKTENIYLLDDLPKDIKDAHFEAEDKLRRRTQAHARAIGIIEKCLPDEQLNSASLSFDRHPEKAKTRAINRAQIIADVKKFQSFRGGNLDKVAAIKATQAKWAGIVKFSQSRYFAWVGKLEHIPPHCHKYYLLDLPKGPQGRRSVCSQAALDLFVSGYLNASQPTLKQVYRNVANAGHVLPSLKTMERMMLDHLGDQAKYTLVFFREGREAAELLYPSQRRSVKDMHAYECVNIDGHRFDANVKWADGTISRPMILAIQDIYSRKALAWRMCRSENRCDVLGIFGDCFAEWGLPSGIDMDNGRSFTSSWVRGQGNHSFRGSPTAAEPMGVLTALGIDANYVQPYHGQSKPIERMWRTVCANGMARSPEFIGAYVGNSVENKPHNYGEKAVDEATARMVMEREFTRYNALVGRRTEMGKGRLSCNQVFAESYQVSPIRKATNEHLRLCMLPLEAVRADRKSGLITVFGNRYFNEALNAHTGRDLVVRFAPENLHQSILVYSLDQVLICEAACVQDSGHKNLVDAQIFAAAKGAYHRKQRAAARALKVLTDVEVAQNMPGTPALPTKPKAAVIKVEFPTRDPNAVPPPIASTPEEWAPVANIFDRVLARR